MRKAINEDCGGIIRGAASILRVNISSGWLWGWMGISVVNWGLATVMDLLVGPPEAEDLSAYCKTRCGLDVSEVSELSEVPRRTLYDWWRNRRRAVELIVKGLASEHKK
ncbi:hypothetical protein [Aeromonas caviae]|uniref:Uncharacterized protein n=1 Tax=Aeromonas caviae TaxID=648 RepID=A0AAJ6CQ51_AERCA|nr:hypothetical protein [Aeromonas caviae]WFG00282.1 hypothetical protein P5S46_21205 [Aeromonas caviae]